MYAEKVWRTRACMCVCVFCLERRFFSPHTFRRRTAVYRENAREKTNFPPGRQTTTPGVDCFFRAVSVHRAMRPGSGREKGRKKNERKGGKTTVYQFIRTIVHGVCTVNVIVSRPARKGGDAAILITRPNRRRGPIDKRRWYSRRGEVSPPPPPPQSRHRARSPPPPAATTTTTT